MSENVSFLFTISNEGRVYALSSDGLWKEFTYLGLEFKAISAIPHILWALGGDRQIYLHVHGLDEPIRIPEISYENERWFPIDGFTGRLLPTDRYHFSSQDGLQDRNIEKIRLPSMAWQWEGDWRLDLLLDDQPLEHDGWTYAIDFPAQYGPTKQWTSCVRRRKWVRYRKYSAMNSWCAIAPLHKDPTREPFTDVSIGGNELVESAGYLSVWAVTAQGRVMFRTGVSFKSPEGLKWTNVAVPANCDIQQISVGPSGLVWTLLWCGQILVRKGVTKDNLIGEAWIGIKSPTDAKICVISVGYDCVWALSTDGRVWFRKGIVGVSCGIRESDAIGAEWLEVGGNMSHISVAQYDQVFAIGTRDKHIYWRYGIKKGELNGKRWKTIPLHINQVKSMSSNSLNSKHQSLQTLDDLIETNKKIDTWEETHSAPVQTTLPLKPSEVVYYRKSPKFPSSVEDIDFTGRKYETTLKNPRAWSPVRSVGSVLGIEAHPEECDDDTTSDTASENSKTSTSWKIVEAGSCFINTAELPHWFSDFKLNMGISSACRLDILNLLQERQKKFPVMSTYLGAKNEINIIQ